MSTRGFDDTGLKELDETLRGHVADGDMAGLTWLVARHGEVHTGTAGTFEQGGAGAPIERDTIFRISSMTKPIVAAAALSMVEDGTLALDDPVDPWIPELADRRVMIDPEGSLDDTVPANRPISLRDLLTFRLGLGMDFSAFFEGRAQPVLERSAELGLGAGPPEPQTLPPVDEWMRLVGTLPLSYQPGERWLYNTGADVLGVLLARAAGMALGDVLRQRIFDPLGMRDTGFWVPAADRHRLGPCFAHDPDTGASVVFDPADGQWTIPPAMPQGGAGLVSTLDDYAAFAAAMLGGGAAGGGRILSQESVAAMTTDQLTERQRVKGGPDPEGARGWGFGLGVQVRPEPGGATAGTYGWAGGLGSVWANDPAQGLTGILFTNQAWSSPEPPAVCSDLWAGAYAALG
jgi:CubicO group peptidase (beta-lactamase class C family)